MRPMRVVAIPVVGMACWLAYLAVSEYCAPNSIYPQLAVNLALHPGHVPCVRSRSIYRFGLVRDNPTFEPGTHDGQCS